MSPIVYLVQRDLVCRRWERFDRWLQRSVRSARCRPRHFADARGSPINLTCIWISSSVADMVERIVRTYVLIRRQEA